MFIRQRVSIRISDVWRRCTEIFFPDPLIIKQLIRTSSANWGEVLSKACNTDQYIHSLFSYRDRNVRLLIKYIKYKGNPILIHKLGELLHERVLELFSEDGLEQQRNLFLIPIPMPTARRLMRHFNQTELLAKAIAQQSDEYKTLPALKRIKKIDRQTGKHRFERIRQARGLFAAHLPKQFKPTRDYCIVIDDVTTTGATLTDARRALRRAGAKHVYALTIAH